MPLHWKIGDAVVDGVPLLPSKPLKLEARGLDRPPGQLQIHHIPNRAMTQLCDWLAIPARRLVALVDIERTGPHTYASAEPWPLPVPQGFHQSAAFVFTVGPEVSRPVYSSRIGKAFWEIDGAGLSVLPVGSGGQAAITVNLSYAADPVLEVRALTGRDLAYHMLANIKREMANQGVDWDEDLAAYAERALPILLRSLDQAYGPPRDWIFGVGRRRVEGDAGDPSRVVLTLQGQTPGQGYVAVTFRNPESPGLPEQGETTDLWAITMDADGRVYASPDVSLLELPGVKPPRSIF